MPECPHCHQYSFGEPYTCPKCNYCFSLKRVISAEQIETQKRDEQQWRNAEIQRKNALAETELKEKQDMLALAEEAKKQKQIMLAKNPLYEYHTEMIRDTNNGIIDKKALDNMLTIYANEGWRLHSVIVNESGKTLAPFAQT